MNTLKANKDLIFQIKEEVYHFNSSIITPVVINNHPITNTTVSIVMTTSNRSKQTYYTLDTIKRSIYEDIHVIIVDDSTYDPIKKEVLETYPFYIDFITINRANKKWHNPLVNYNIGFKYVKGCKVIIQNSEVCHVNDVSFYIYNHTFDNNYYVMDVKASKSFETNEMIYSMDTKSITIFNNEELFSMWYQHESNNRNYHFLTAMTRNTFELVKNFSYDCTMGTCFDDDDFLLKIKSKGINIVNLFNVPYGLGGIHLFHTNAIVTWDNGREHNNHLFSNKLNVYNRTGHYVDVTENYNNFDIEYNKLV